MAQGKCITLPNQLIVLGLKELSKEKFTDIENREGYNKPHGGLWCCPYKPNEEYVSAWQEWCTHTMPEWLSNDAVIITLNDDAMYWCIDDQEGLQGLVDIVGEQEDIMKAITGRRFSTYIDFEKARETFDAIYLTEEGAWKTHTPSEKRWLNLYGWDIESVLLTNFECIESWEYIKLDAKEKS